MYICDDYTMCTCACACLLLFSDIYTCTTCFLTPPDPSLTPDNILQATHDIPLWRSLDSYHCLDMPKSLHEEIAGKYDGEQAKCELVSTWLAGYPCPTWEHVKYLLEQLEYEGRGRKGAAEEVEETYLESEL